MNKTISRAIIAGGLGILPGLISASYGMEESTQEGLQQAFIIEDMANLEQHDSDFEDKFAKFRVEIPTNDKSSPLVSEEESDLFSSSNKKSETGSESDDELYKKIANFVLDSDSSGFTDSESDSDSSSSHDYLAPKWDDYLNVQYDNHKGLFYIEDIPTEITIAERIGHLMRHGLSAEKAQAILIARGIMQGPVNVDPTIVIDDNAK
jgi:hypothetical protein